MKDKAELSRRGGGSGEGPRQRGEPRLKQVGRGEQSLFPEVARFMGTGAGKPEKSLELQRGLERHTKVSVLPFETRSLWGQQNP